MDLIFSNLSTLKTHLLAASLVAGTDYDTAITALGRGVAGSFEKHCNRSFVRAVAATYDFTADRCHVVLPRYPIETITKVELRETLTLGYVDQGTVNDIILNISEKAGLVQLASALGDWQQRVRLTYTGGYHVNILEPDAMGYPTALPAGATALPYDLLFAWLLQCEHVWAQRDKLGTSVAEKAVSDGAVAHVELLPAVLTTLRSYVQLSFS